jgi:hypothetical protein
MVLVDNDNGATITSDEVVSGSTSNSSNNGLYYAMFYAIGSISLLGVGFLIVKFRNKVRVS